MNTLKGDIKGEKGELEFEMLLINRGIKYVSDIYLKVGDKTTQVDFVVFRADGISIVEVKNFSNCVVNGSLNSKHWKASYYKRGEYFYNPFLQNLNHVYMLKKNCRIPNLYLNNFVCFNDKCTLNIKDDTYPRNIYKFSELDYMLSQSKKGYSEEEIDRIYNFMTELKVRNSKLALRHNLKFN